MLEQSFAYCGTRNNLQMKKMGDGLMKDNLMVVVIMLLILGHMLKMYSEILKDRSMKDKGRK